MAVVSEVTSMDMQECRKVEVIRSSRHASNGVSSAAASFVVAAAAVGASLSLAPPCSDHDLTRMNVSSAPTPDQNSRENYFHQMKRGLI